jgi:hypothetical protein
MTKHEAITLETVTHKGLYSALAAAQGEMGRALKDTNNPHFKSKYADLASVCDACMPALSKHGIAVLQPAFDDESGRYVKTILVHGGSGETAECRVPLIVSKNDMQGYGSAVTYARRYGLMGMAGIAPEDDDGNAAAESPPMVEPRRQRQSPKDDFADADAINNACEYLRGADDMPDLQRIWGNIPRPVASLDVVIAAKDDRKRELQLAATAAQIANPDIGNDAIPY